MTPVVLLLQTLSLPTDRRHGNCPNLPTIPLSFRPMYFPKCRVHGHPTNATKRQVPLLGHPGTEGFTHILGGLEKDNKTGAISTDPENHDLMTRLRAEKIAKIEIPDVKMKAIERCRPADCRFRRYLRHLHAAMEELRTTGKKVALAHFKFINPAAQEYGGGDETLQESSGGRTEHGTVCRIPAYESRRIRFPVQQVPAKLIDKRGKRVSTSI